jgi:hypothetical protein
MRSPITVPGGATRRGSLIGGTAGLAIGGTSADTDGRPIGL